ncbi:hypothetical protein BD289DRAFT_168165 [Coniella lustricola]|uniref:Uncharacterized protein n=1 Tax=Coniella lustricola TaxID=2025994 RepID=A0A2T2ZU53_9PEZI|nr:hypothetical protein BD289DRAFT_168165 [Coniella lustricola]
MQPRPSPSSKWKLALLPKNGRRRQGSGVPSSPATSPLGSGSDTNHLAISNRASERAGHFGTSQDAFDCRLISALLDTMNESQEISGGHMAGVDSEWLSQIARSQTLDILSGVKTHVHQPSPENSQAAVLANQHIPRRSWSWNHHQESFLGDASLPNKKRKGSVRPVPHSQSAHIRVGDLAVNSPRLFGLSSNKRRMELSDAYQIEDENPAQVVRSVTTALLASQEPSKGAKSATDATGSAKVVRSRTKNVLTKLTGAFADRFKSITGSRKREHRAIVSVNATEMLAASLAVQGMIPSKPSSNEGHSSARSSDAATILQADDIGHRDSESDKSMECDAEEKPIMMVYEPQMCCSQGLEDPFTDSLSGNVLDDLRSRTKASKDTKMTTPSTDPFQTERILETNVDAILMSPPIGYSTPRRPAAYLPRYKTPSKLPRELAHHKSSTMALSSKYPLASGKGQDGSNTQAHESKHQVLQNDPSWETRARMHKPKTKNAIPRGTGATRQSSYPPSSTDTRVPRSVSSRQADAKMPLHRAARANDRTLTRKKHPSPSKGQLEFFGKCMDKSLAMGRFAESDEPDPSASSSHTRLYTLSPRDKNRLARHSKSLLSNDHGSTNKSSAASKRQTRIPKPVRQLSRSRIARASDFYPPNKDDSPTDDELQWETSEYKIGHRCSNCGSINKAD